MAINANAAEGAQLDADDVEFLVVMRAVRVFRILKVSKRCVCAGALVVRGSVSMMMN